MALSLNVEVKERTPRELQTAVATLKSAEPNLRARDIANKLDVSEAELVAMRVGDGVTRLDTKWTELVKALPLVGEVMVLTRNEHCVHEKTGTFNKVRVSDRGGIVLDPEIDLRIFFSHWAHAFHVTEALESGVRQSIQIFDHDGTAVHKIYARPETNMESFDALVGARRAVGQGAGVEVTRHLNTAPDPKIGSSEERSEADVAELKQRWSQIKDIHDFFPILADMKLERVDAFAMVEGTYTKRIDPASFKRALELAAEDGLPIMIFVPNPGVIQIHTGPIVTVKEMGPWINVLDPRFNLHLRMDSIAKAWVVRKPSVDGDITSLEIFDENGQQIAFMFGARKPGDTELTAWRALIATLEGECEL
ncbi:MAG: hemin-degrading factor [Parvibaculaceae bacterium]|nr:hemin-degrading factor [Parvibaculaceae bacterium]